jgi:hypothetical protein
VDAEHLRVGTSRRIAPPATGAWNERDCRDRRALRGPAARRLHDDPGELVPQDARLAHPDPPVRDVDVGATDAREGDAHEDLALAAPWRRHAREPDASVFSQERFHGYPLKSSRRKSH